MPSPELTSEILAVARSVTGVQSTDQVFARKTGLQYHIDLHMKQVALHFGPVEARHAPPVGAIVLRGIMSSVKFRVGRRLRSSALVADAWNNAVDILSALAALTAVALATYDPVRFLAADHYGGFVVGIVVVITGIRVVRDASLELVDTSKSIQRSWSPHPTRLLDTYGRP